MWAEREGRLHGENIPRGQLQWGGGGLQGRGWGQQVIFYLYLKYFCNIFTFHACSSGSEKEEGEVGEAGEGER